MADASADAETAAVLHAIQALYGMEGPERQRQANAFLVEFAETATAWHVGLQILTRSSSSSSASPSMEALFFAANMLHAKARTDWAALPPSQQAQIATVVRALLQDAQHGARPELTHQALHAKLCGVLAVALCSQPHECHQMLDALRSDVLCWLASVGPTTNSTNATNANDANDATANDANATANAVPLFVTLTRCLCEELELAALSFAAKDAMDAYVASVSDDLVRVLADLLLLSPSPSVQLVSLSVRNDVLRGLQVWMKRAGTSLTRLFSDHASLLQALLQAVGERTTEPLPRALSVAIVTQAMQVAEYPSAALQQRAVRATARQLLAMRRAYDAVVVVRKLENEQEGEEQEEQDANDECAHAITDVVTTFTETYVDWLVAQEEDDGEEAEEDEDEALAQALGEFLLHLGLHPRRQLASLTLETWLLVAEEPVASRRVFFQQHAFEQLLTVVVRQCQYPRAPEGLDDLVRDDLLAFRHDGAQGLQDVVLATLALRKDAVVAQLGHVATHGLQQHDWRQVEVALFLLSLVARELTKLVQPATAAATATATAHRLEPMLLQLVSLVLETSRTADMHALVVASATQVLGPLASWLGTRAPHLMAPVLGYVTEALALETSASAAAKSFLQLATQGHNGGTMAALPTATLTTAVSPSAALAMVDRLLVVEALVRVAAQSSQAPALLQALLMDDCLPRLAQALQSHSQGPRPEEALAVVDRELQVCATVVRFLDAPSAEAGGPQLTQSVVDVLWPHLAPVAVQCAADERVMAALLALYSWCLQSLGHTRAEPRLGDVVQVLVAVFTRYGYVAALECASLTVDVCGRAAEAQAQAQEQQQPGGGGGGGEPVALRCLTQLLGELSRVSFQLFTAEGVAAHAAVLQTLFALSYRALLYCPSALVPTPELRVLLQLGAASVATSVDRGAVTAVVQCVSYVLTQSRGGGDEGGGGGEEVVSMPLGRWRGAIDACVWRDPEALVQWVAAVLTALASHAPSVLFDALARLWWALWTPLGEHVDAEASQLLVALTRQQLRRVVAEQLTDGRLGEDESERVVQLWRTYASMPTRMAERKFRALCSDVAKICRRELAADALAGYEGDVGA